MSSQHHGGVYYFCRVGKGTASQSAASERKNLHERDFKRVIKEVKCNYSSVGSAETAAKASLCCPLSPGPKTLGVGPCSPSMAEAGSIEVAAQAIISTPGLARDVLLSSYISTLEVPYRELVLLQYLLQGGCCPCVQCSATADE